MWKTLAIKELRETAGIALLALLASAYWVGGLTGLPLPPFRNMHVIPFVSGDSTWPFVMIGAILAVSLALRQSVGELLSNTFVFLLHRPVSRDLLLTVKLLTGLFGLVLCMGLPIIVYAGWAATPGNHASPFQWAMTLPICKAVAVLTVLYLSAFLSGLRPASWFGTRVFPLVGGGSTAVILYALPWTWGIGLLALAVVDTLIILAIFSVAEDRDY